MNHCHDCNSDYEAPGTCNCFTAGGKRALAPYWIPAPYYPWPYGVMPYRPYYHPYYPDYPYWYVTTCGSLGAASGTITTNPNIGGMTGTVGSAFSAGLTLTAGGM